MASRRSTEARSAPESRKSTADTAGASHGAQTVVLDDLDPSLVRQLSPNGRSQSHWPRTNARHRIMAAFYGAARAQGLRLPALPVRVTFCWIVPTRARRDIDNLAANGIQKAVIDCLVRGEWLPDDSSDHVREVRTEMRYERKRRALEVTVEPVGRQQQEESTDVRE